MKTCAYLACIPVLLVLAGCLPSVQPFCEPSEAIFDPALIGTWRSSKDNEWEQWTFTAGGDNNYLIDLVNNEEKTGRLKGMLFELGGRRYLDLIADSAAFAKSQHDLVSVSVAPCHLLASMDQENGSFRVIVYNWDWLATYLDKHPESLAHRREGNSFLLTASTAELQRFVIEHGDNDELFPEANGALFTPAPAESAQPR